jgi:anti-sigma factor RsiW
MDCAAYEEIAAAHADGRLAPAERAAADAHVAACPRCAAARRTQSEVAKLLRERRLTQAAPEALRRRIDEALASARQPTDISTRRWRTRILLAGAVAAGLALLFLPRQLARPDLLTVMARDVRAAQTDQIALAKRGDDFDGLKAYYRSQLDLAEPVIDLRPANFHLVGGTIDTLGTTPTALTVYEGRGGKIVCRRFRAGEVALPPGGREIDGARYFEVDGVTIRVQRIGDMICCTASAMPIEAMARLFAMPGAARLRTSERVGGA